MRKKIALILLLLFVLSIYFCLVPSRTRITPETTGITGPLRSDGTVDYLAVYENSYIDQLRRPEDNGLRLVIAALGPAILEQYSLMNSIPWEELPRNEYSKRWFGEKWIPFCEKMNIDPYKKPRFHSFQTLHTYLEKQDQDKFSDDKNEKYRQELIVKPWKREDHPEAAAWLDQTNPVLDLYGVAVRKPIWRCWRVSTGDREMITVLLPDVQSSREICRELQIRITEKLSRNDIDGAWYDTMSIYHLARHLRNDQIIVTKLVGIALEMMGFESAQTILTYGNPTAEQLERFANDLATLPKPKVKVDVTIFEKLVVFDTPRSLAAIPVSTRLQHLKKTKTWAYYDDDTHFYKWAALPFDSNIAGRRISKHFEPIKVSEAELDHAKRRAGLKRLMPTPGVDANKEKMTFWRFLFIHTRSELLGDLAGSYFPGAFYRLYTALDQTQARFDLLRLAIAIERYQRKHLQKKYPETLDELVPQFLEEIPLDIFTSRNTITYRRTESGYLIYSYGANGTDDNGEPSGKTPEESEKGDVVLVNSK